MPELEIDSAEAFLDAVESLRSDFKRSGKITLSWKCEGAYTPSQRNSLHLWCEMLAKVLNDAGMDQTTFYKHHAKAGMQLPWTKHSIKETFYKPTLETMTGKRSTEEMNTLEPSEICTIIGKALSERLGITPPPFPSRFND